MTRAAVVTLVLLLIGAAGASMGAAQRDWFAIDRLTGHNDAVLAVALSDDARYAVSLDASGELRPWHVPRRKTLRTHALGALGDPAPEDVTLTIAPDRGH